jgi:hypothetical protein
MYTCPSDHFKIFSLENDTGVKAVGGGGGSILVFGSSGRAIKGKLNSFKITLLVAIPWLEMNPAINKKMTN